MHTSLHVTIDKAVVCVREPPRYCTYFQLHRAENQVCLCRGIISVQEDSKLPATRVNQKTNMQTLRTSQCDALMVTFITTKNNFY